MECRSTLSRVRLGTPNFAFEADAARQRSVSCYVSGPRRSTQLRYAPKGIDNGMEE
jgi:hypothetical protein